MEVAKYFSTRWRTIVRCNRFSYTVVGVAPSEFKGSQSGLSYDLWVPLSMAQQVGRGDLLTDRSSRNLKVAMRLQPGATLALGAGRFQLFRQFLAGVHPGEPFPSPPISRGAGPRPAPRLIERTPPEQLLYYIVKCDVPFRLGCDPFFSRL